MMEPLRSLAGVLALAVAFAAAPALGQQDGSQPAVKAHLTSGVVKLGDRVTLVVTVENARDVRISGLPDVDGLTLGPLRGPSTSQQDGWINGRRYRTIEHTWVVPVQPLRPGEFRIPPIEVSVDGRRESSSELNLTVVEDLRGADLGLFEVRASSERVYEGQPFSIELILGWDAGLVQRVNYRNLALPWWDQLSGLLELETDHPHATSDMEFFLNSTNQKVLAERLPNRTVHGRDFVVCRLVRSFLPTRSGSIELPTSFFEFGEVVEHRDFFKTEWRKVETWFVSAPAFTIDVVPLPEAGRPVDYSGAIGHLNVAAGAEPRDVDAGDSIKFSVEWSGDGNLEFFDPPDPARVEAFRGFRVYGMAEEVKTIDRRRVTYDLAPMTSEVDRIPSLPLVVFDPELGRYRTIETEPIPIRVRPLEGAVSLGSAEGAEELGEDVVDIASRPRPAPSGGGPGGGVVGGLLAATPLLWLGLRTAVRRRRDPDAPLERRRRSARRVLARALDAAPGAKEQLDALNVFLASRSRELDQAWTGRDIEAASASGEVPLDAERALALVELVGELERSAFGGDGAALPRERIMILANDLMRGGL